MQIRVISSCSELEAMTEPWFELLQRSRRATPFQAPEWLLPWWHHFGSGKLNVLVFEDRGVLVGLAPLCLAETPDGPTVTRFIGTGNTDYLDLLAKAGHEEVVLAEFSKYIAEMRRHSRAGFDFQELREEALATSLGPKAVQEVCPVVPLQNTSTWEDLRDVWSAGLFTKLQKYRRRLEREGTVQYEAVSEKNFSILFETIVTLHQRQWGQWKEGVRTDVGVFGNEKSILFHREAAQGYLKKDLLRLYCLSLNGVRIAAIYGFVHHRRAYYYISGFDPLYAQFSPGSLIIAYAMEQAVKGKIQEFDFLRGAEPYKYRWGAVDRRNYRILMPPF